MGAAASRIQGLQNTSIDAEVHVCRFLETWRRGNVLTEKERAFDALCLQVLKQRQIGAGCYREARIPLEALSATRPRFTFSWARSCLTELCANEAYDNISAQLKTLLSDVQLRGGVRYAHASAAVRAALYGIALAAVQAAWEAQGGKDVEEEAAALTAATGAPSNASGKAESRSEYEIRVVLSRRLSRKLCARVAVFLVARGSSDLTPDAVLDAARLVEAALPHFHAGDAAEAIHRLKGSLSRIDAESLLASVGEAEGALPEHSRPATDSQPPLAASAGAEEPAPLAPRATDRDGRSSPSKSRSHDQKIPQAASIPSAPKPALNQRAAAAIASGAAARTTLAKPPPRRAVRVLLISPTSDLAVERQAAFSELKVALARWASTQGIHAEIVDPLAAGAPLAVALAELAAVPAAAALVVPLFVCGDRAGPPTLPPRIDSSDLDRLVDAARSSRARAALRSAYTQDATAGSAAGYVLRHDLDAATESTAAEAAAEAARVAFAGDAARRRAAVCPALVRAVAIWRAAAGATAVGAAVRRVFTIPGPPAAPQEKEQSDTSPSSTTEPERDSRNVREYVSAELAARFFDDKASVEWTDCASWSAAVGAPPNLYASATDIRAALDVVMTAAVGGVPAALERVTVPIDAACGIDPATCPSQRTYPREFAAAALRAIRRAVSATLRAAPSSCPPASPGFPLPHLPVALVGGTRAAPDARDVGALEAFIKSATELDDEPSPPLVIVGGPGAGKTALAAVCAARARNWLADGALARGAGAKKSAALRPPPAVIVTPGRPRHTRAADALAAAAAALSAPMQHGPRRGSQSIRGLDAAVAALVSALGDRSAASCPAVVVIDDADALAAPGTNVCSWLPALVPPHTRLVVTARSATRCSAAHGAVVWELAPPADGAASRAVTSWLRASARALPPATRRAIALACDGTDATDSGAFSAVDAAANVAAARIAFERALDGGGALPPGALPGTGSGKRAPLSSALRSAIAAADRQGLPARSLLALLTVAGGEGATLAEISSALVIGSARIEQLAASGPADTAASTGPLREDGSEGVPRSTAIALATARAPGLLVREERRDRGVVVVFTLTPRAAREAARSFLPDSAVLAAAKALFASATMHLGGPARTHALCLAARCAGKAAAAGDECDGSPALADAAARAIAASAALLAPLSDAFRAPPAAAAAMLSCLRKPQYLSKLPARASAYLAYAHAAALLASDAEPGSTVEIARDAADRLRTALRASGARAEEGERIAHLVANEQTKTARAMTHPNSHDRESAGAATTSANSRGRGNSRGDGPSTQGDHGERDAQRASNRVLPPRDGTADPRARPKANDTGVRSCTHALIGALQVLSLAEERVGRSYAALLATKDAASRARLAGDVSMAAALAASSAARQLAAGEYESAASALLEALRMWRTAESVPSVDALVRLLGSAAVVLEYHRAAAAAERAAAGALGLADGGAAAPVAVADVLRALAAARLAVGRPRGALAALMRLGDIMDAVGMPRTHPDRGALAVDIAAALLVAGRSADAAEMASAAREHDGGSIQGPIGAAAAEIEGIALLRHAAAEAAAAEHGEEQLGGGDLSTPLWGVSLPQAMVEDRAAPLVDAAVGVREEELRACAAVADVDIAGAHAALASSLTAAAEVACARKDHRAASRLASLALTAARDAAEATPPDARVRAALAPLRDDEPHAVWYGSALATAGRDAEYSAAVSERKHAQQRKQLGRALAKASRRAQHPHAASAANQNLSEKRTAGDTGDSPEHGDAAQRAATTADTHPATHPFRAAAAAALAYSASRGAALGASLISAEAAWAGDGGALVGAVLGRLAAADAAENRSREAIRAYDEAIQRLSSGPCAAKCRAWAELGAIHRSHRRSAEAARCFSIAARELASLRGPDSPDSLVAGRLAAELACEEASRTAAGVRTGKVMSGVLGIKAHSSSAAGRWRAAISRIVQTLPRAGEAMEAHTDAKSALVRAHVSLGEALLREGRRDAASGALRSAIAAAGPGADAPEITELGAALAAAERSENGAESATIANLVNGSEGDADGGAARARVLVRAARALRRAGRWRVAVARAEDAVAVATRGGEAAATECVDALVLLAEMLVEDDAGVADALGYLERAVDLAEEYLGDGSPETAAAVDGLAATRRRAERIAGPPRTESALSAFSLATEAVPDT